MYIPIAGEVDVTPIASEAWANGKVVAAPRLDPTDRSMVAVRIENLDDDLVPVKGTAGLLEPRGGLAEVPVNQLDLVLVPGLAFDREGNRLGRGAGYYDRFLTKLAPKTLIVGVCQDEQIVEHVPTESHDVRMHALLTPTAYIPVR